MFFPKLLLTNWTLHVKLNSSCIWASHRFYVDQTATWCEKTAQYYCSFNRNFTYL